MVDSRHTRLGGWNILRFCDCDRRMEFILEIVTPTKILFQPDVGDDKKVTGSHFADLQLGFAGASVAPRDGYDCERVPANNRFLKGSSTVRLKCGASSGRQPSNNGFAIGFKGICGVVESVSEQHSHEVVGKPIDPELQPGIVDDTAAFDEAATETRSRCRCSVLSST